jgi:hypothetical protein
MLLPCTDGFVDADDGSADGDDGCVVYADDITVAGYCDGAHGAVAFLLCRAVATSLTLVCLFVSGCICGCKLCRK